MIAFAGGNRGSSKPGGSSDISSLDLLKAPAPVFVRSLQEERLDVIHTYSGMVRPKDRYSIGFEVGGRVLNIKQSEVTNLPIDVGYRVKRGDVLAELDPTILNARQREAKARYNLAQDNLQRAVESRRRVESSVSLAEIQRLKSEQEVAAAQLTVLEKELQDIRLQSPVDGVVARRMVEVGETVNAHQVLFEIVKIDEVVLVVGVPESRLPELLRRRQEVEANRREAERARSLGQTVEFKPGDLEFRAEVRQLGEDRFGRPWPRRDAEIYHIAETADDRSGLFEVEVLIDNRDFALRPGFIALADIVIDRIDGYQLPIESIQLREGKKFLYTAEQSKEAGDESDAMIARRHELTTYIDQKNSVIIPTQMAEPATSPPLPTGNALAVVQGQHRLVDGRRVNIVEPENGSTDPPSPTSNEPAAIETIGAKQ